MVLIHFETNQQAEKIMQIISQQFKNENYLSYMRYEDSDTIFLEIEHSNQSSLVQALRESFLIFIKKELLHYWLLKIVEEKFFFSENAECEQIVEIALSIIQEDKPKNEAFWNELKYKIHHGLVSIFERKVSFSFPSFLTFRMRGVMEKLLTYVESAIDEYKMEQEYQSFIHILRTHMLQTSSKLDQLHVKHQHSFDFYKEDYQRMTRTEVIDYVDRKLFSDYPMYIDSHVLAPLISIAPKHVFIYSDEDDHPLIITIQQIFEERVSILPISLFIEDEVNSR